MSKSLLNLHYLLVVVIEEGLQVSLHAVTPSCDGLAASGADAVVQSVEALLAEKMAQAALHNPSLVGHVLKTNGTLGVWRINCPRRILNLAHQTLHGFL